MRQQKLTSRVDKILTYDRQLEFKSEAEKEMIRDPLGYEFKNTPKSLLPPGLRDAKDKVD